MSFLFFFLGDACIIDFQIIFLRIRTVLDSIKNYIISPSPIALMEPIPWIYE